MNKQKIIVVDINDNLIGVKFRNEIDYSKDIYRCTGIWITNFEGEILLAKRSSLKDKDPSKWGPGAAGTLEEGDTYEGNAYKELEEELGVTGAFLTKGPKVYREIPRKYFGQWYFCVLNKQTKFTLQKEEVDEVAWVTPEFLKQDVIDHPEKYVFSLFTHLEIFFNSGNK